MALGRFYTVDSAAVALTATSQTPIILGATGATVTIDITGIRVTSLSGASSPTYPANSSVQAILALVGNSPTGGTSKTPRAGNSADIAANSTWTIGSWTIAPTIGNILWSQGIPFTPGAAWGEYYPTGSERRLAASGFVALFLTLSATSTSTSFQVEIDFVE